jgi:hypothetical protein
MDNREAERDAILAELSKWSSTKVIPHSWKVVFLSAICIVVMNGILLWSFASLELLARIQTFNGAITIPVGAIIAFLFTSFVIMLPMKCLQLLLARVMRYSIDVTENMTKEVSEEIRKATVDFKAEAGSIRGELKGLSGVFTKKIEPPPKKPVSPVVVGGAKDGTNGEGVPAGT